MKILVTGASGYVGSHVINALTKKGHSVIGLVRDIGKIKIAENTRLNYVEGDIKDIDNLIPMLDTVDGVMHSVAGNSEEFGKLNHAFVSAVLKKLEDTHKPFVMQAGSMVFGDTTKKPLDDAKGNFLYHNPPQLDGQVALEKMVLESAKKGVRPIISYGSYVFGGKGAMIPNVMTKTINDLGYSPVVNDGTNIWSSVHIEDWADLFASALENDDAKGIFMASSNHYTLKQIAELLDKKIPESKEVKSVKLEEYEELWDFFTTPLATMNQNYESSRARDILGWKPDKTQLEDYL